MYIYMHTYLLHLIDVTNWMALVLREMFMKMLEREQIFIEIMYACVSDKRKKHIPLCKLTENILLK